MVSTLEEKIAQLIEEVLVEQSLEDYFLVDIKVAGNRVEIFMDSDNSVHVDKCKLISRQIEAYLDEHKPLGEDYTIEVSSAGVGNPLKMPRQYKKNIGRDLEVLLLSGTTVKGLLLSADEDHIILQEEKKEKVGKKNIKQKVDHTIPYDNITKAVVKIRF